jgi:hypothetical protein
MVSRKNSQTLLKIFSVILTISDFIFRLFRIGHCQFGFRPEPRPHVAETDNLRSHWAHVEPKGHACRFSQDHRTAGGSSNMYYYWNSYRESLCRIFKYMFTNAIFTGRSCLLGHFPRFRPLEFPAQAFSRMGLKHLYPS